MDLNEARELLESPIWPKVRDTFLATGVFGVYPKDDLRRLEYLDDATRASIAVWKGALAECASWRLVVDGARVRELKARFPGAYPEAMRYEMYFKKFGDLSAAFPDDALRLLLKLKFPEAYALCCS